jgi:TrmH family RNA methyltransferase
VTELSHKQLRDLIALQKANARQIRNRFLIEGRLCVEEALNADFPLEQVLFTSEFQESESGSRCLSKCQKSELPMIQVPSRTLQRISSQEHSQGVLAIGICREGAQDWAKLDEDVLIVIPNLSDPGNLGTIFRTARVFGVSSIWLGDGTVDSWHPKVVRGSMGSIFHLNLRRVALLQNELLALKHQGVQIWALDSNGHTPFDQVTRSGKTAVILGHEAQGIPQELLALSDARIILGKPNSGVGSLNVAVAAGILLFLFRTEVHIP